MKLLVFLLVISITNSFGQSKLPNDLDSQLIIFLEYDINEIDSRMNKRTKKYLERVNKLVINANKLLVKEAKKYPFKYDIKSRSELSSLDKSKNTYVLINSLMEAANNSSQSKNEDVKKIVNTTNPNLPPVSYTSPLCVKNLLTGDKYELFSISDNTVYKYDKILSRFNKKVVSYYKKR